MKKVLIIFSILLSIEDAQSQMWKQLPLSKISDSIYIDETEVSIKDWVTYISDLSYYNPQITIENYLPDSNKVKKECRFYLSRFYKPGKMTFTMDDTPDRPQVLFFPQIYPSVVTERYFAKHIAMSEVPITGITFEQALEYCEWRTKKINAALSKYQDILPIEYKGKKIIVRLCTPKEFAKYSSLRGFRKKREIKDSDYSTSYSIDSIVPGHKCATFLYKHKFHCDGFEDNYGDGPMPPALFFSDFLTVYDWLGNVAEMTSEKGIAKGGSFAHFAKEADPINEQYYVGPEDWLGFRCILQIE